ncbi:MAG TPA: hypothetical protein VKD71_13890 [Gemmataceae bacterium]|nr:hypothetical protein [Gemmataceae bacterium]
MEDSAITSTSWDIPSPILLNVHKHHAAFLRQRIGHAVVAGPSGLQPLSNELVVVGMRLMDLYHGPFAPREIADRVLAELRAAGRDSPEAFRTWVEDVGGYRTIDFVEDASRWVLRFGEGEGRFIHVHPARGSPFTMRVRANVLVTAVMALAFSGIHGGDPLGRKVVNAVRRDYLGLEPLGRNAATSEGIGAVIALLS